MTLPVVRQQVIICDRLSQGLSHDIPPSQVLLHSNMATCPWTHAYHEEGVALQNPRSSKQRFVAQASLHNPAFQPPVFLISYSGWRWKCASPPATYLVVVWRSCQNPNEGAC